MFKAKGGDEGPAPGPVSFRLGELAPAVQRRVRPGVSLATVVRRNLAHYYDLLWNTELPDFTIEEADALTLVLWETAPVLNPRFLASEVIQKLDGIERRLQELGTNEVVRPRVTDLKRFSQKLEEMTAPQQLATLDAVERYWAAYLQAIDLEETPAVPHVLFQPLSADPINEFEVHLLREVGLVHPIYADRYMKEHGMRTTPESKRKVLSEANKRHSQR